MTMSMPVVAQKTSSETKLRRRPKVGVQIATLLYWISIIHVASTTIKGLYVITMIGNKIWLDCVSEEQAKYWFKFISDEYDRLCIKNPRWSAVILFPERSNNA
jgi:hypothetical protein